MNSEDALNLETSALRDFLSRHKGMNGGLGLVVPRSIGDELRRRGLTEHYTVMWELPRA